MKNLKMYFILITMTSIIFIASSCSTNTANNSDQEVKAMDSVSNDLNKTDQELDAQAKKVEASLEKIDKENIVK